MAFPIPPLVLDFINACMARIDRLVAAQPDPMERSDVTNKIIIEAGTIVEDLVKKYCPEEPKPEPELAAEPEPTSSAELEPACVELKADPQPASPVNGPAHEVPVVDLTTDAVVPSKPSPCTVEPRISKEKVPSYARSTISSRARARGPVQQPVTVTPRNKVAANLSRKSSSKLPKKGTSKKSSTSISPVHNVPAVPVEGPKESVATPSTDVAKMPPVLVPAPVQINKPVYHNPYAPKSPSPLRGEVALESTVTVSPLQDVTNTMTLIGRSAAPQAAGHRDITCFSKPSGQKEDIDLAEEEPKRVRVRIIRTKRGGFTAPEELRVSLGRFQLYLATNELI